MSTTNYRFRVHDLTEVRQLAHELSCWEVGFFTCLSTSPFDSYIQGVSLEWERWEFEKVLTNERRGPILRNSGPIRRNTVSLDETTHPNPKVPIMRCKRS